MKATVAAAGAAAAATPPPPPAAAEAAETAATLPPAAAAAAKAAVVVGVTVAAAAAAAAAGAAENAKKAAGGGDLAVGVPGPVPAHAPASSVPERDVANAAERTTAVTGEPEEGRGGGKGGEVLAVPKGGGALQEGAKAGVGGGGEGAVDTAGTVKKNGEIDAASAVEAGGGEGEAGALSDAIDGDGSGSSDVVVAVKTEGDAEKEEEAGEGRVKNFSNLTGRVRSGQEVIKSSRVGSGHDPVRNGSPAGRASMTRKLVFADSRVGPAHPVRRSDT